MKPRDLFGVVIRCIGVLMAIGSVLYLYSALVVLLTPDTPNASSPLIYIGMCVLLLILSVYFLRGAPRLVRFAYREERENGDD